MKVGIIGSGDIGQRLARHFLSIGNEVILCNSRGPETLRETVASLGEGASAGTLADVSKQEIVVLAVWWDTIPKVMAQIDHWSGRILIDATNMLTVTEQGTRPVKLENMTGSEYVASLAKGARVVKAFNHLFGQFMDGSVDGGNRVLFYAGDDTAAKETLKPMFEDMGFYPIDLGNLAEGGQLMQVGGPLNGKHFIKRTEDMCL